MNWRVYQRIFELAAVAIMMTGLVMMWMRKDSLHLLVYGGFILLATGKMIEAINLNDPNFKIIKVAACLCIYLLVMLNLFYQVRTIVYVMVPLGVYYALHYRWMFQQKRT